MSAAHVQEVAATSREQSSNVAQVGQAMERIDTVTQQNVAAANELSATAEQVAAHAGRLAELVAYFHAEGRGARG
jgi:methyl-accepting chemotaxis protein